MRWLNEPWACSTCCELHVFHAWPWITPWVRGLFGVHALHGMCVCVCVRNHATKIQERFTGILPIENLQTPNSWLTRLLIGKVKLPKSLFTSILLHFIGIDTKSIVGYVHQYFPPVYTTKDLVRKIQQTEKNILETVLIDLLPCTVQIYSTVYFWFARSAGNRFRRVNKRLPPFPPPRIPAHCSTINCSCEVPRTTEKWRQQQAHCSLGTPFETAHIHTHGILICPLSAATTLFLGRIHTLVWPAYTSTCPVSFLNSPRSVHSHSHTCSHHLHTLDTVRHGK